MNLRSHFSYNDFPFFLRNAADANGGSDSNSDDTSAVDTENNNQDTASDTEFQKRLQEAIAKELSGIKAKNSELIEKNKKLAAELNNAKTKQPQISDEEFAEYLQIKERIERDELLKAFHEGKSEEVIERLNKRTRAEYEAKLAAEAEARRKAEEDAVKAANALERTVIDIEITRSVSPLVKPNYHEMIAKMISDRVKMVDGQPRVVNAEGEIEMNTSGTKPLTIADLVEGMRSNFPEIFVTSTGGGSSGSGRKSPTGGNSSKLSMDIVNNMSTEEYFANRKAGRII